jgi:hypothetical protein
MRGMRIEGGDKKGAGGESNKDSADRGKKSIFNGSSSPTILFSVWRVEAGAVIFEFSEKEMDKGVGAICGGHAPFDDVGIFSAASWDELGHDKRDTRMGAEDQIQEETDQAFEVSWGGLGGGKEGAQLYDGGG